MYEPFKGTVMFHTKFNAYFKENIKLFDATDFIAELPQHIPPLRMRLVRYYGLYSSRSRWTRGDFFKFWTSWKDGLKWKRLESFLKVVRMVESHLEGHDSIAPFSRPLY